MKNTYINRITKCILWLLISSLFCITPLRANASSSVIVKGNSTSDTLAYSNSSPLIDNYISVVRTSITTSHVLTIVINVKNNIPIVSNFSFFLGYEYPSCCRTSGYMVDLRGYTKGQHTIKITTKGLVCGVTVSAFISAHGYKEHKQFRTLFDRPYTTCVYYHTVSSTDVVLNSVAAAFPSALLMLLSHGASAYLNKVAIEICDGIFAAVGLASALPGLAVGQYYVTTTTYTTDFKCKTTIKVYSSKASMKAGEAPIAVRSTTINLPV